MSAPGERPFAWPPSLVASPLAAVLPRRHRFFRCGPISSLPRLARRLCHRAKAQACSSSPVRGSSGGVQGPCGAQHPSAALVLAVSPRPGPPLPRGVSWPSITTSHFVPWPPLLVLAPGPLGAQGQRARRRPLQTSPVGRGRPGGRPRHATLCTPYLMRPNPAGAANRGGATESAPGGRAIGLPRQIHSRPSQMDRFGLGIARLGVKL
jgi:hypothetical protein